MDKAVICALALLMASPAAAEVVFDATPDSRVNAGPESTARTIVRGEERSEARLIITRKGGRYFWTTRENRELLHSRSGAIHLFVAPAGAGYVKVLDSHLLPESVRKPGPRYHYLEHVAPMLGTLTYWGSSDKLLVSGGGSDAADPTE